MPLGGEQDTAKKTVTEVLKYWEWSESAGFLHWVDQHHREGEVRIELVAFGVTVDAIVFGQEPLGGASVTFIKFDALLRGQRTKRGVTI